MATIKDIARQANVSTATVSYVLNGLNSKVGPETRRKILKVIKELNYRPNLIARGLTQKKTFTLGVMIVDMTNPFFIEIIKGIHDACKATGYNFILCYTEDNLQSETEHLYSLMERQVDGIVLCPVLRHDQEPDEARGEHFACLEEIARKEIPILSIVNPVADFEGSAIVHDMRHGAMLALEHLYSLGHRRIAFLTGPTNVVDEDERYRAYKDFHRAHGLPLDSGLVIECEIGRMTAHRAMQTFLKERRDLTALFAFNDYMAIGAMKAILEAGLRIPHDVAVVGFDNIDDANYATVPLSSVNLQKYELGQMAVNFLNKFINNDLSEERMTIMLQPSLVVRDSCGGQPAAEN